MPRVTSSCSSSASPDASDAQVDAKPFDLLVGEAHQATNELERLRDLDGRAWLGYTVSHVPLKLIPSVVLGRLGVSRTGSAVCFATSCGPCSASP